MRVHKKVSALFVLTGIFIIQSRECNEHLIGEREKSIQQKAVQATNGSVDRATMQNGARGQGTQRAKAVQYL